MGKNLDMDIFFVTKGLYECCSFKISKPSKLKRACEIVKAYGHMAKMKVFGAKGFLECNEYFNKSPEQLEKEYEEQQKFYKEKSLVTKEEQETIYFARRILSFFDYYVVHNGEVNDKASSVQTTRKKLEQLVDDSMVLAKGEFLKHLGQKYDIKNVSDRVFRVDNERARDWLYSEICTRLDSGMEFKLCEHLRLKDINGLVSIELYRDGWPQGK